MHLCSLSSNLHSHLLLLQGPPKDSPSCRNKIFFSTFLWYLSCHHRKGYGNYFSVIFFHLLSPCVENGMWKFVYPFKIPQPVFLYFAFSTVLNPEGLEPWVKEGGRISARADLKVERWNLIGYSKDRIWWFVCVLGGWDWGWLREYALENCSLGW